jgi:hypothetical protein
MNGEILLHKAVLPAAHLRQLLKAQSAMEHAANAARVMAVIWVFSVVSVELGELIFSISYFPSPPPNWTNIAGWVGLIAALVPGRLFRRRKGIPAAESGADTVAVAHEEVLAAERALSIYYIFGAAMVVSEVVAFIVYAHNKNYTFPLQANAVMLLIWAWPMLRKGTK